MTLPNKYNPFDPSWRITADTRAAVRAFARAVLHGDNDHQEWLLEAADAFLERRELPSPRGKGTQNVEAETSD